MSAFVLRGPLMSPFSPPCGAQVATLKAQQLEKGVTKPFPALELKEFLPHWSELVDPKAAQALEPTKHLKLQQWAPAFDRYSLLVSALTHNACLCAYRCSCRLALTTAAAGLWEFTSALAHKDNCLQVMARAPASGRQSWLAVVYDHLAREEWSRRAGHNEPAFDVNQVRASFRTLIS